MVKATKSFLKRKMSPSQDDTTICVGIEDVAHAPVNLFI